MNLSLIDPFRRQVPERITETLSFPRLDPKESAGASAAHQRMRNEVGQKSSLNSSQSSLYSLSMPYYNPSDGLLGPSLETSNTKREIVMRERHYPVTISFNRRGSYFAIGYDSGMIVIHDFNSNNVVAAIYHPGSGSFWHKSVYFSSSTGRSFPNPVMVNFLRWGRRGRTLLVGSFQSAILRLIHLTVDIGPLGDAPVSSEILLPVHPSESKCAVQMHPKDDHCGMVCLLNGQIAVFRFTLHGTSKVWVLDCSSACNNGGYDNFNNNAPQQDFFFRGAVFVPNKPSIDIPEKILAITKCGRVVCMEIPPWTTWDPRLFDGHATIGTMTPNISFEMRFAGKTFARDISFNRRGDLFSINSSDNALRLYRWNDVWGQDGGNIKPTLLFDSVAVNGWSHCDFSGDGEFLAGACNVEGRKYQIHIWNTTTGQMECKLYGPRAIIDQSMNIAWHPNRPFIVAATSDGLTDIWGPSLNWTTFAPDFHALQDYEEYVEKEDEFDSAEKQSSDGKEDPEDEFVDVVTIEKIPAFASDSEDEEEVFSFPIYAIQKGQR